MTITRNVFLTHSNTLMTLKITQPTEKHATADRRTNAHLTETASNHQSSTKQPSKVPTITLLKHTYRNHTASFRHAKHKNSTELSKHIWSLKDSNIDYSISWNIISSSSSYNSSSKRCNLCLREKFLIICRPDLSSLNKLNELVSSCRHRSKALLRNNLTLKHLNFTVYKDGSEYSFNKIPWSVSNHKQVCWDENVDFSIFNTMYHALP